MISVPHVASPASRASLIIALKIKLRMAVLLLLVIVGNFELRGSCYIRLRDVHTWFSENRPTGSKVAMATHIIFLSIHPQKRQWCHKSW
jgi:hypothetical protein